MVDYTLRGKLRAIPNRIEIQWISSDQNVIYGNVSDQPTLALLDYILASS